MHLIAEAVPGGVKLIVPPQRNPHRVVALGIILKKNYGILETDIVNEGGVESVIVHTTLTPEELVAALRQAVLKVVPLNKNK